MKMDPVTIKTKLVEQGKLRESQLRVLCNGGVDNFKIEYRSREYAVEIDHDLLFLSVSSEYYNRKLMRAFERMMGDKPFTRYRDWKGNTIIEWDKYPDLRFKVLKKQEGNGIIGCLVRLK